MEKTKDVKILVSDPMIYSDPNNLIYSSSLPPAKTFKSRNFIPSAFSYILAFLEIGYFLCFVPFRCKLNSETGQYEIVKYLPQKLITILFHIILSTCSTIWYISFVIKHHFSDDPLRFFRISESLIGVFYCFVFSHFMILKVNSFELFFKLAQEYHLYKGASSSKKYSLALFTCFAFVLFGFLSDMISWITALNVRATDTKILNYLSQNGTNSVFSFSESPFGSDFLHLLLSCWHSIGEGTCILLFAFGWYLRQICEDLGKMIVNEENTSSEILKQYLKMKEINATINSITKYMILSFVIGSIPYISQAMTEFSLDEPKNIVTFLTAGNGFLLSMLGSAEANSKANQLKHALLERQLSDFEKGTDLVSLQMLLSEFSCPDIGLKGMHFFTVTYSFVGVMLAQCLVYALIILQLKGPTSST